MKYIRTKYAILEDKMFDSPLCVFSREEIAPLVIKQADNLEELIMPHDLVQCGLDMYLLEKDEGICLRAENMHLVERKKVDRLWIAVGEDIETYPNFKLVAEKDEETGEMILLARVDHIDKIVKKKLDDMTQKEIEQVSSRLCFGNTCHECPFTDDNDFKCLDDFLDWKKRYLDNKDKEFEIEVEVEE